MVDFTVKTPQGSGRKTDVFSCPGEIAADYESFTSLSYYDSSFFEWVRFSQRKFRISSSEVRPEGSFLNVLYW